MKPRSSHIAPLLLVLTVLALALGACGGDRKRILSESKLCEVLFDYHIADGYARTSGADTATSHAYFEAVLRKHGVSKEEFDSTMLYYMRHADKLHAIYQSLADRMENEARLQGVENSSAATMNFEGDTANIWMLEKERVLTAYVPDNLLRYHIEADTTFKPGDRFTLSFRSDFLYQEGTRNGYVAFSVKFLNDSVVTRTVSLSSNNTHTLEVKDDKRIGVKEIRGFFMQRQGNAPSDKNTSPLRFLVVSDISLIKMHTDEPEPEPKKEDEEKKDTLSADTMKVEQTEAKEPPAPPLNIDRTPGKRTPRATERAVDAQSTKNKKKNEKIVTNRRVPHDTLHVRR